MRTTRSLRFGLAAGALALLVAAGCGSDDTSDSSSTTTGPSSATTAINQAELVKFDKTIQQQLADVGCYSGSIDGIFGPATDAAVIAFQTASGLEVDGELGPETEAALAQASSEKEKVCTGPTTTVAPTTTTTPSTAPCTATALAKALPSGAQLTEYACSEGYAGAAYTAAGSATTALLEASGTTWEDQGNSTCGTANAGLPPAVLTIVCPG